jgi:hypothetical protein
MKTKTLLLVAMKAKVYFMLTALMMMTGGAFSQSIDSINLDVIPYHYTGGGAIQVTNLMKQHDGSLVSRIIVSDHIASSIYPHPIILGTSYYKFAPASAEITDSLFVPGSDVNFFVLLDKDPRGDDNVRINTEPNGEGGTNLRIAHFPNDDFIGDPSEDVVVPLCDEEIFDDLNHYMIDCRGDIIWRYYTYISDTTYQGHIARIGLDGTLKYHTLLPETQNFNFHFGVFSEHPLKYYQWKTYDEENGFEYLTLYVLDSLFQRENSHVISKGFLPGYDASMVHFCFDGIPYSNTFVLFDGGDMLVAAPYWDFSRADYPDYSVLETGTAVVRYDLRTMEKKAIVMFNDIKGNESKTIPLCFHKSSDGSLYFVFREIGWDFSGYPTDGMPITALKMDPDLNVLWKRYVDMPTHHNCEYNYSVFDEDNDGVKIAIAGNTSFFDNSTTPYTYTNELFYLSLTEDGTVGMNEKGIEVRPYCFYPNPVKEQLLMQFSPDVQPVQIELYDLQGRLVRTQSKAFESIDMGQLPTGTYTMRVTLEDGKVYSDKVVKE